MKIMIVNIKATHKKTKKVISYNLKGNKEEGFFYNGIPMQKVKNKKIREINRKLSLSKSPLYTIKENETKFMKTILYDVEITTKNYMSNCIFVDNDAANWFYQNEISSTLINGVHNLTNLTSTLNGAFPHLNDENGFSSDFNLPICFEFDIVSMNIDEFRLQIYPTSTNYLNITPYITKGSHVRVEVYSDKWYGYVDDTSTPTFQLKNITNLKNKCRIGLQLINGRISFSNFIIYSM